MKTTNAARWNHLTAPPATEGRAHRTVAARLLALAGLAALGAGACSASSAGEATSGAATHRLDQSVLGSVQSFAVLAGSTVTNTGDTVITGNLGVDPGLAITGFPPGFVTGGTIHAGDAVAHQAESDTTAAYLVLTGQAPTANLTGKDLGGMTLTPGVYTFSSSAQLTGELTLDAQGDAAAIFVFQIASTLTTASESSVVVVNGASDCNVFWQVGTSATLGTTTTFKGSVLALTSITLNTGALVSGRVLARNAAVTLDTNVVSTPSCATGADGGVEAGSGSGRGADAGRDSGSAAGSSSGSGSGWATGSSSGSGTGSWAGSSSGSGSGSGGYVDAGTDAGRESQDSSLPADAGQAGDAYATGAPR